MKYHMLLVANRRYHLDAMVEGQIAHLEDVAIGLGNQLQPGEWIEFETSPFPSFLRHHDGPEVRPHGALPRKFVLGGEFNNTASRPYNESYETFGGRRRLLRRLPRRATRSFRSNPRFEALRGPHFTSTHFRPLESSRAASCLCGLRSFPQTRGAHDRGSRSRGGG